MTIINETIEFELRTNNEIGNNKKSNKQIGENEKGKNNWRRKKLIPVIAVAQERIEELGFMY